MDSSMPGVPVHYFPEFSTQYFTLNLGETYVLSTMLKAYLWSNVCKLNKGFIKLAFGLKSVQLNY